VRTLKDRLSEVLRAVEEGSTFVVTSHGRRVAELAPHREPPAARPALSIRPATRAWGSVKLPRGNRGRTNSLELLLEERRRR
jgi:prevent-host-death family protein